jgi:glycerol-3-phosphate dehydrogenase
MSKRLKKVQEAFFTPMFRVYVNTDLIGVEVAGSVKNIMALAAGAVDGIGYGDNAKAALITRGLAELSRLGIKLGANPMTFAGLAGIGDLGRNLQQSPQQKSLCRRANWQRQNARRCASRSQNGYRRCLYH